MISSIIIEDNPAHSKRLTKLINEIDKSIKVLNIATNVNDGVKAINEYNPELIFLDVKLEKGESGFELLEKIDIINFDVIFTTAHIDRNINKIRACSLDYLHKPIIPEELKEAIKKFIEKQNEKVGIKQLGTLKSNLQVNNIDDQIIWIADKSINTRLEVKNILYCESSNTCTTFYFVTPVDGKSKILSTTSIGEWEDILAQLGIYRIHNQYLANLKYIDKYTRGEGGLITMTNKDTLPVSKSRKKNLLKLLGLK